MPPPKNNNAPPPQKTQNKTEKWYKQKKMISTDLTNPCTYDVSFVISSILSKFGIKFYLFKEHLEYFTKDLLLNSQIPP